MNNTQITVLSLLQACLNEPVEGITIPEDVDWQALINESDRQNVSVHASDGLQKLYDAGIYRALGDKEERRIKARWFGKTLKYEQRYINQLSAAKELADWLATEGIQIVVMKGLTVAECYPNPSHRYSSDLDCFLIKDGEHMQAFEQGNQVMEKHGVEVSRGFYKNSSFHVDGLYVENHKFCTPFRGNEVLEKLERLLQKTMLEGPLIPFEDSSLLFPPSLFSALFLIEHSYSHFLHEGLNLRHILDWMMFRRHHQNDVDWSLVDHYIDEFGFRRFYDAYVHVGEFILGERVIESLTESEHKMMDSIWEGLDLHETVTGIRGKLNLVGNTLRAGWKYKSFSDLSMLHALWIEVKGFLFINNPSLS